MFNDRNPTKSLGLDFVSYWAILRHFCALKLVYSHPMKMLLLFGICTIALYEIPSSSFSFFGNVYRAKKIGFLWKLPQCCVWLIL